MTGSDNNSARPIGILAGNGSLPVEIARAIAARGGRVAIVAINSDVDPDLARFDLTHAGLGQIGRILAAFRAADCRELVIVGGVSRPDLARLTPDFGIIANLPDVLRVLTSGGDDGVLRAVVRFFEAKGFTVVSPADVAPDLVVGAGALTAVAPTLAQTQDILLGSRVVKALGVYDVGQAVIVSGGELIAIEAAEGTDAMLQRVASLRQHDGHAGAPRGVLVKRPKPGQEMRVDLPAIGPATVTRSAAAGLAGVAVLAGQTLAAQRGDLLARARLAGLFIYGFTEGDALRPPVAGPWNNAQPRATGARRLGKTQLSDARLGAAALGALGELARNGAAVVHRGHVLALNPGGDVDGLIQRAARLKQWGEGRRLRGLGVLVLGEGMKPDLDIIAAAGAARLAGVASMGQELAGYEVGGQGFADTITRAARAAGVFLVQLTPAEPTPLKRPT